MMSLAGRISIANSKPSCFFCGSKRQRNLVLVGEDALGNPELIDFDGMGVHGISKAIKYRADYKNMRWIYWACLRCFYLGPSKSPRYRDLQEKKEVVAMRRAEGNTILLFFVVERGETSPRLLVFNAVEPVERMHATRRFDCERAFMKLRHHSALRM